MTTGQEAPDVEFDQVPVDDLHPWPGNPRRGDVEAIKSSIRENGFVGAIVARPSDGRILAGHHRWRAARELGFAEVPVLWREVDDERGQRIVLADNRTSDLAGYDRHALAAFLEDVRGDGGAGALAGTGYGEADLRSLLAAVRPETPPEFPRLDDDTVTTSTECPRCGHRW